MQLQLPLETRTIYPAPTPKHAPVLAFVVQKHWASSLHYDLRIRCFNHFLSWAIKPGPSMVTGVKAAAVRTDEDNPHGLHHWKLETIIPKGEYGAGPMLMWDRGTYTLSGREANDTTANHAGVEMGTDDGRIQLHLHGQKLKGEFQLCKRSPRSKSWYLEMLADAYAYPARGKALVKYK